MLLNTRVVLLSNPKDLKFITEYIFQDFLEVVKVYINTMDPTSHPNSRAESPSLGFQHIENLVILDYSLHILIFSCFIYNVCLN